MFDHRCLCIKSTAYVEYARYHQRAWIVNVPLLIPLSIYFLCATEGSICSEVNIRNSRREFEVTKIILR